MSAADNIAQLVAQSLMGNLLMKTVTRDEVLAATRLAADMAADDMTRSVVKAAASEGRGGAQSPNELAGKLRALADNIERPPEFFFASLGMEVATIREAAAALGRQAVLGWKLVPVEPTVDMAAAGQYAVTKTRHAISVWGAMLASSPPAPAPAPAPEPAQPVSIDALAQKHGVFDPSFDSDGLYRFVAAIFAAAAAPAPAQPATSEGTQSAQRVLRDVPVAVQHLPSDDTEGGLP